MARISVMLSAAFVGLAALPVLSQIAPSKDEARPSVATPVALTLRTDKKQYAAKDPIKFTITAKCPAKTPVKLMFGSGMKYDIEIRKAKAPATEKVWQWMRGRMFIQMVTFTTVSPDKPLVFNETFTPGEKGADGRVIAELTPGTYTATAVLALSGRAPRPTTSVTFSVR